MLLDRSSGSTSKGIWHFSIKYLIRFMLVGCFNSSKEVFATYWNKSVSDFPSSHLYCSCNFLNWHLFLQTRPLKSEYPKFSKKVDIPIYAIPLSIKNITSFVSWITTFGGDPVLMIDIPQQAS